METSNNQRRMLHTMIRVGDMARSVAFYTEVLGMRVLRTLDQPSEQYCLTFLGYDEESNTSVLELTYNYGVAEYQLGNGYGHIAIGVDNCQQACNEIEERGGTITLSPTPLAGSNEIIAFVSDPDGYAIEVIQQLLTPDGISLC